MNIKNTSRKHAIIAIGILLLIISIVASMCIPTTCIVEKAYTEEYLVPVYKTVTHNDPIYADKYKTVTHKDPIYEDKYKTVTHRDPKYETVYTYRINGNVVKNVYDVKKEFTGIGGFWSTYNEYKVTVYYYDALSKTTKIFYEVPSSYITLVDTYETIVGYNKWTEKVLDGQEITGYDIWTEQVLDGQKITGYNTWTEKVVDRQDTKERIAYKDVKYNMSLANAILCGADKIVLDL